MFPVHREVTAGLVREFKDILIAAYSGLFLFIMQPQVVQLIISHTQMH